MNNIREWISDNLRYILLGLALILVLAVAVFGIRAISNIANGGSSSNGSAPKQTEAQTAAPTDAPSDVIVETEAEQNTAAQPLTKDDAKVLTTMQAYYNARVNGDTETLRKLDPSMTDLELAKLKNSYVEGYNNITTYSRPGLTEGSYVAYVCYDGKVRDIDTMVPSLIAFYLMSDESGSLYIVDTEGDAQVEAFLNQSQQTEDVQQLISSVQQNLQSARGSDPALNEFMEEQEKNQQGGGSEPESETEAGESSEVVAIDNCNIRTEPNTDSDENIIGSLYVGDTATKTGETDDGWTIIDFNGETAYVSSDYVTTPEEAQQMLEADYFAPGDGSGE